jgi:hypothetical protein
MSETLENSRGESDKVREVYASLYLDALRQQIEEYKTGCVEKFIDMDEDLLQEIDEAVEPCLEEMFPDLFIKRVGGLDWIILDWETMEKKILDTNE